eukprot:14865968-Alexandrium_andersonii.AAC.1
MAAAEADRCAASRSCGATVAGDLSRAAVLPRWLLCAASRGVLAEDCQPEPPASAPAVPPPWSAWPAGPPPQGC